MMANAALARDREHILHVSGDIWQDLRDSRVFITGGTGFVGTWLMEAFLAANHRYKLNANAVLLTRNPSSARERAPHIADDPAVTLLAGDARSFAFPTGEFACIVHAATERATSVDAEHPVGTFSADVAATQRVLEFTASRSVPRFLLTSSGAVYGRELPAELPGVPEGYAGAPDVMAPSSEYGEGKRASELSCASYGRAFGFAAVVARLFAFVGPRLPLNEGYAVGNFIADALAGRPISIGGDGTACRSYLYAADLAVWLWTILLRGAEGRAYNVGSSVAVSIGELAHLVAATVAPSSAGTGAAKAIAGAAPSRYVPDVSRAERELGLKAWVELPEAIRRTYDFHTELRRSWST